MDEKSFISCQNFYFTVFYKNFPWFFFFFFPGKKKFLWNWMKKKQNIFKVKIFFPCKKPHLHFIFILKLFHPVFHETKIIILHIVPLGLTKKKKFSWEKNQKNRRIFFPSEKRSSCQNLFLNSVSSDFFPTSLFLQDIFSFPSVKKRSWKTFLGNQVKKNISGENIFFFQENFFFPQ